MRDAPPQLRDDTPAAGSPSSAALGGRLGSPLATLLLLLSSTTVSLLLAEGIVRVLGSAPAIDRIRLDHVATPFRLSADPILGYELKPSFDHPEADGIRTNSRGLRDPEREVPKPPGVRRIALLGDSVVMGSYLTQESHLLSQRLERLLAPQRVEVINMGVKGYCTLAEARLLQTRGLDLEPDLAMIVFVRNDHRNFNAFSTQSFGYDYSWQRPGWSEALFVRSDLFRLAALRFDWFRFASQLDPEGIESQHRSAYPDDDNVEVAFGMLEELRRTRGLPSIVVVWPDFDVDGPAYAGRLFEQRDQRGRMKVETCGERHGIPVVRLAEAFRAEYARRRAAEPSLPDPKTLYTFEGMHPNPEGTRTAALLLKRVLDAHPDLGFSSPGASGP